MTLDTELYELKAAHAARDAAEGDCRAALEEWHGTHAATPESEVAQRRLFDTFLSRTAASERLSAARAAIRKGQI
jgi:hypothetical protein